MEENNNVCGGNCCQCGGCGMSQSCGKCGHHMMHGYSDYKHHLLRKVLLVIAMLMIFFLGVAFGELKSMNRNYYHGEGMMGRYGDDNYSYMMRGGSIYYR